MSGAVRARGPGRVNLIGEHTDYNAGLALPFAIARGVTVTADATGGELIEVDARDLDDMVDRACRLAFREGFAKAGQRILIVAGVPLGTPGATNMVRIAFVGSDAAGD